jgi:hypothetical protein
MGAPLNVSGVGEAVPAEALLFRYPQSLAWVMLACSFVSLAAVLLAVVMQHTRMSWRSAWL